VIAPYIHPFFGVFVFLYGPFVHVGKIGVARSIDARIHADGCPDDSAVALHDPAASVFVAVIAVKSGLWIDDFLLQGHQGIDDFKR
jgi:hypothetical protein